jgi:hypothetical protein
MTTEQRLERLERIVLCVLALPYPPFGKSFKEGMAELKQIRVDIRKYFDDKVIEYLGEIDD